MPSTPSVDNTAFTSWLDTELLTRNWTRQTLADRSGIHPGVISRIASNDVGIGLDVAKRIAAGLNMSQIVVLEKAGLIDEELYDDETAMREIRRLLAALPENERETTIDLIDTILRRTAQRIKDQEAGAKGRSSTTKGKA